MARAYDSEVHGPAGYDAVFRRDAPSGYGRDYGARDPGAAGYRWPRPGGGRRRRLVPRTDWRLRGGMWHGGLPGWRDAMGPAEGPLHGDAPRADPGAVSRGYERHESYPRGERHSRDVPPHWRRYLSREEYGLGPGGAYDREYEGDRFRRGPLGPRNALFGGEAFVRYDRDYDEQWW